MIHRRVDKPETGQGREVWAAKVAEIAAMCGETAPFPSKEETFWFQIHRLAHKIRWEIPRENCGGRE